VSRGDYARAQAAHTAALHALAETLAASLPILHGTWSVSYRETPANAAERYALLTRSDGLALELIWDSDQDSKPWIGPKVPSIPGSTREKVDIGFAFSVAGAMSQVAARVDRKVVVPWEAEKPRLEQRQAATLAKRAAAMERLDAFAAALGVEVGAAVETGVIEQAEGRLLVGRYGMPVQGELIVSVYAKRVRLELEMDDDALVVELAELLRTRTAVPETESLAAA
jgi:hypothetical protein